MSVVVGAIFLGLGVLFATNAGGAAERAFRLFARVNPTVGTATPSTLRVVGALWIPLGGFFVAVGLFG
ncbi:hypothetical protein GCM10009564_25290 [Streptomyces thermogriseus]|jgi:hypothetical protein|uniref:Uncharacterized protein n=1 Tax=Streptomyces thermogriseus TaxID=75292 RepID=A0ABP4DGZ0_9ACTN